MATNTKPHPQVIAAQARLEDILWMIECDESPPLMAKRAGLTASGLYGLLNRYRKEHDDPRVTPELMSAINREAGREEQRRGGRRG